MRKSIYQFARDKAYALINLNVKLSSGAFIEIKNRMEWIIYNDIFVEGDYDEPIFDTLKNPCGVINILDLGANVGFFNFRVAHLASCGNSNKTVNVKAIEGSRHMVKELQRRLKASSLNADLHTEVIHGLVGLKEGNGILYEFNNHGLNSVFRPSGKAQALPYINVSEVCKSWNEIHLVKCDIEGSELSFIQNYPDVLKKTQAIVVECHREFCDPQQCNDLLIQSGFTHAKRINDYGNSLIDYFRRP